MIQLTDIKKAYKQGALNLEILKNINLFVRKGEFITITGRSGSGKSTLLHIIGCLDSPTFGSYQLDGQEMTSQKITQLTKIRNQSIGFIFQQFHLIPRLSILHNVELPLIYRGVSPKERTKQALEALDIVGLRSHKSHLPSQLSGGQQQRVAIARAIITKPKILLADEPTGSLDSVSTQHILSIFLELHQQGHTIILITHDSQVAQFADRQIILHDGMIIDDTPLSVEGGLES